MSGKTIESQLSIPFDPMPISMVSELSEDRLNKLARLERIVFDDDDSGAHKTYFKYHLFNYIKNEDYTPFIKYLWNIIWERDQGKTLHYLYFNERSQKIYVDRVFIKWAHEITEIMELQWDKIIETQTSKK